MKRLVLLWSVVIVSFLAVELVARGQGQAKGAAVVNGETITLQELEKQAAADLERLEQQRTQFELTQQRERVTALESALDEILEQRLLEAEAKKRSVSVDGLVQSEVDSKVPPPTDEAIEKFYQDNRARINGTLDQLRTDIASYLRDQARGREFQLLIGRLKKQYGVQTFLEPMRTVVATEGHPTKGPSNAPVTIVEFSDFECPYCGSLFPTLQEIEKNYKDKIRIVYRQFPLTNIHPNAQKAAEASLCANEQKQFWALHDAMFLDQSNLNIEALKKKAAQLKLDTSTFNSCLDLGKYAYAVRLDMADGTKAGVNGTPALFVNGRFFSGNQPYEDIAEVIEDELQRAAAKR